MPQHADPGMRKALRVLLLLFGVAVLTSVITIATHRNNPTPVGATPPVTSAKRTTTTVGGKVPVTSAKGTTTTVGGKVPVTSAKGTTTTATAQTSFVLFNIQGSGDDPIGQFVIGTAATQWDVQWTYNSKVAKKGSFNYIVAFKAGARPDLNDVGPKQHGTSGSGVEHYYDAGTFDMTVTSDCNWTIKVTEIAS